MHQNQTAELRQATQDFSNNFGAGISSAVEANSTLLVLWLQHLDMYQRTGIADSLLDAIGSSIREVAGVLSLGLVRQAIFSLRGQIDLMLAWLYFKDHNVEWLHVNETAEGFKLKKEMLQYLEQHVPRFNHRMGILRDNAIRKERDPYRLLSAHIHAQSDPVLPVVANLKDLVRSSTECEDCAQVAFEVSEFINDILLSIYLSNFASLPHLVKSALDGRFKSVEQRKAFFS